MVDLPTFEKRFDRSFNRVYAYVASRVASRATAERLTREVLQTSLGQLVDSADGDLDVELLRATQRVLRNDTERNASPAQS
jgi:hypothetical protein